MRFQQDDGGRAGAGFKGSTGDCVTRALAIATGLPYREVYDEMHQRTLGDLRWMRKLVKYYGPRARSKASPRAGVPRHIYQAYLEEQSFVWVPTMKVGQGCTVHLREEELPGGTIVCRLSRHLTTVVDGVIRDTFDPSRDGTRCVYGYFKKEGNHAST